MYPRVYAQGYTGVYGDAREYTGLHALCMELYVLKLFTAYM